MNDNVFNFDMNTGVAKTRADYFDPESPLYFKTYERPAYFKGKDEYHEDPKHKHIVRMIGDKPVPIGLVGTNYKVLSTQELCEEIEDSFVLSFSQEQLDGVQRTDSVAHYGGQCIRQYIFPNINVDIGSRRSEIAFRTVVINGYDGASSFKLYSGAIDFFCTNGMVSGVYDMMVRRHTKGLTVPKLIDKVERSIDVFYKNAEQWKHWVNKKITDDDAEACFGALPNASDALIAKLVRQFHIECLEHGRTVWALYSAATYYATHNESEFKVRDTGNDHAAITLMDRERQVSSWLHTDEFEKLAA